MTQNTGTGISFNNRIKGPPDSVAEPEILTTVLTFDSGSTALEPNFYINISVEDASLNFFKCPPHKDLMLFYVVLSF